MFKIIFSNSRNILGHVVREAHSLEEAVRFGLDLHASSNVPHVIYVRDQDDCDVITFSKADASRDSVKNE